MSQLGEVCMSPFKLFLPFTKKIFRQPIPENLLHYFFADAPVIFFLIVLPLDSILGTPSTKYFFALIKKIQTLVEIILRPPYEQNLHMRCWVSK